jgi:hypothetical protein
MRGQQALVQNTGWLLLISEPEPLLLDSIGEKIADLLKPLVLLVHVLLPGKKDVLGQSGTSRLLIRPPIHSLID